MNTTKTMLWGAAAVMLVMCACAPPAMAQRYEITTDFQAAHPAGNFSDNIDTTGLGFNTRFAVSPQRSGIWSIGAELGFARYGSQEWNEPISEDFPDVPLDIHTNNNILLLHAVIRVQKPRGKVRPYGEALIGGTYLFTDTGISNCEDCHSTINFDDWALSSGVGAGLLWMPWPVRDAWHHTTGAGFGFDFGVRYLKGGNAEYLKRGSIARTNGELIYDVYESDTSMILPHIGFVGRF